MTDFVVLRMFAVRANALANGDRNLVAEVDLQLRRMGVNPDDVPSLAPPVEVPEKAVPTRRSSRTQP